MKKGIILIAAVLGMMACESDKVKQLNDEKDALHTTITESETRLKEIEEEMHKLGDVKLVEYPNVTVTKIQSETFEHFIKIQGVVEAGAMVMVIPEVGGVITNLPVQGKEGMEIKKGELIARFDSETVANNIAELDVQIDLAETMMNKQQKLYDQGLGNIIQLDQAKGQFESLKKTKQSLLTQKGKFSLTAPFDGIIEKVYVVQGQMAGPSTGIIMLVGKKERKVVAKISETYLKNLHQGSEVTVEFPVLGETLDSLEVTRVGGFVDPVNRTIDLDVKLKNFNVERHVPNLMANIKVRDNVVPNALLIPSKVILKGSEQSSYVFVLTKNEEKSNDSIPRYEVSKKVIKIGDMYNGKTIVLDGLKAGDIVIDRGRGDVSEGSIVEVSDF